MIGRLKLWLSAPYRKRLAAVLSDLRSQREALKPLAKPGRPGCLVAQHKLVAVTSAIMTLEMGR